MRYAYLVYVVDTTPHNFSSDWQDHRTYKLVGTYKSNEGERKKWSSWLRNSSASRRDGTRCSFGGCRPGGVIARSFVTINSYHLLPKHVRTLQFTPWRR